MQVDPTINQRIGRMDRRKANRTQEVTELPETAEQGDTVLFEARLYVHSNGQWRNIDEQVNLDIKALEKRVAALEPQEDPNDG